MSLRMLFARQPHQFEELFMYIPAGFDVRLCIELGKLVSQAYAQFEMFEAEQQWKLVGAYDIVKEFHYTWTPAKVLEKSIRGFDLALDRLRRADKDRVLKIPIGFAAKKKERVYLVFRGTQTAKEWVRNFSMNLSPYFLPAYGSVHEGFLDTYRSVRDEIEQVLSSQSGRMKLFIGGHSLGAAIATLALPDIEMKMNRRIAAAYTFGSPRVGDNIFAKAYGSQFGQRSFRIVNTSDIVTSIPFPTPIMGKIGGYFSHVDTPVDINAQKEDLEQNHNMKTYLESLSEYSGLRRVFRKLF
jgi:triacylglycerol lipase